MQSERLLKRLDHPSTKDLIFTSDGKGWHCLPRPSAWGLRGRDWWGTLPQPHRAGRQGERRRACRQQPGAAARPPGAQGPRRQDTRLTDTDWNPDSLGSLFDTEDDSQRRAWQPRAQIEADRNHNIKTLSGVLRLCVHTEVEKATDTNFDSKNRQ